MDINPRSIEIMTTVLTVLSVDDDAWNAFKEGLAKVPHLNWLGYVDTDDARESITRLAIELSTYMDEEERE